MYLVTVMPKTLQFFSSTEVIIVFSSGHLHILSVKQKSCTRQSISYQTAVELYLKYFEVRKELIISK